VIRAVRLALIIIVFTALIGPAALEDGPVARDEFGKVPASEAIAPVNVRVYEYGFEPSRLLLKAGQVVVWRNIGKELHNITPRSKQGVRIFRAAARRGTTRHLFTKPGTYPYFCSIHTQMKGQVVVRRTLPALPGPS
jgi:plastocyanin